MTRRLRHDQGQALPLVLVFLFVFTVLVGLILTSVTTNLRMTRVNQSTSRLMYAGDGGIESAISQVRTTYNGVCPGDPNNPGAAVPVPNATMPNVPDVSTLTVTCQPIAGPRSNTFGGYSVVTGVKLPTSTGVSPQGNSNCVSLNADGLGAGHATLATGTTCVTYPPVGGGNPVWLVEDPAFKPDGVTPSDANLKAVFALDASDVWAVGDAHDGTETIWYFDGDDWEAVATPTNTGGTTTKNLKGVYAADADHVWAVGQTGTVFYCSSACTDPATATWTKQLTPTNDDLFGVSGVGTTVWTVGNHFDLAGQHHANIALSKNGGAWTDVSFVANPAVDLAGVYAADVNHVWAVGNSVNILSCSASCDSAPAWSTQTTPAGTPSNLNGIDGTDAAHVWAVGQHPAANTETILSYDGAAWTAAVTPANKDDLNAVGAADAGDVFAVGQGGTAYYSSPQWALQLTGTVKNLDGVSAIPADLANGISLTAWAVGDTGTILSYSPPVVGSSVATIEGGPIFNASKAVFNSQTTVANGDFTQLQQTGGSCPAQPSSLTVSSPYGYTSPCPASVPASITSLPTTYHLPNPVAPFSCVGATVTCTQMNANGFTTITCGAAKAAIFAPGYYKTHPNLKQAGITTYFFESGVYYFNTGNWGGIGDDKTNYWIIGGAPSPNDTAAIAPTSPCWSQLQSSGFYTNPAGTSPPAGSWQTGGTGVEWILGGGTWLDVHSIHLELFTREAPTQAQGAVEGAQGISIREVSPGATPAGWAVSNPGGHLQLVQVDANNHNPEFYLHGGIYSPNNNVEFFANKAPVTTGPILANSLELAFATATSPLRINAGGDGVGQYEFVATGTTDGSNGLPKASLQVEAVVTYDRKSAGVPMTIQSWRVRCTPTASNALGNC